MRLLYVALTRAEKKLYLVGKGNADKLAEKYDGKRKMAYLPNQLVKAWRPSRLDSSD